MVRDLRDASHQVDRAKGRPKVGHRSVFGWSRVACKLRRKHLYQQKARIAGTYADFAFYGKVPSTEVPFIGDITIQTLQNLVVLPSNTSVALKYITWYAQRRSRVT